LEYRQKDSTLILPYGEVPEINPAEFPGWK